MALPGNPESRASVAWTGDAIEVIDQTLLPREEVLLRLTNVDEVIQAIQRLAVRGAHAIAGCGALGIALSLSGPEAGDLTLARRTLLQAADSIGEARPTAVNLSWATKRVVRAAIDAPNPVAMRQAALDEALTIIQEDRDVCWRIAEHGRAELAGRSTILTHCNTGRLATAGWGTALGVVYAKSFAGEPVRVFACEARPLLQGARLTAWELEDAGIDVTLIPDGAAAALLCRGGIDAVIVGADRIAANGDTANKIGTLSLAIAARFAGVPFYVAAPSPTYDPNTPTGADIVIEERGADEVRKFMGVYCSPPDVSVWNPAFDVTPAHLIDGFITETGVLRPPYAQTLAGLRQGETGR